MVARGQRESGNKNECLEKGSRSDPCGNGNILCLTIKCQHRGCDNVLQFCNMSSLRELGKGYRGSLLFPTSACESTMTSKQNV